MYRSVSIFRENFCDNNQTCSGCVNIGVLFDAISIGKLLKNRNIGRIGLDLLKLLRTIPRVYIRPNVPKWDSANTCYLSPVSNISTM